MYQFIFYEEAQAYLHFSLSKDNVYSAKKQIFFFFHFAVSLSRKQQRECSLNKDYFSIK